MLDFADLTAGEIPLPAIRLAHSLRGPEGLRLGFHRRSPARSAIGTRWGFYHLVARHGRKE